MGDKPLKFGGWGLSKTGGRESAVKATENKKWMVTKKKTNPAKKTKIKKSIFFHNGARENRPLTPTKKDPRTTLWTTGTSGEALFDKPLNTFAVIRYIGT